MSVEAESRERAIASFHRGHPLARADRSAAGLLATGRLEGSGMRSDLLGGGPPRIARLLHPVRIAWGGLRLRLEGSGALGRLLARDHFGIFLVAVLGALALFPGNVVAVARIIGERLAWHLPAWLESSRAPRTSIQLLVLLLVFLATFFSRKRARIAALILASAMVGCVVTGEVEPLSMGVYAIFAAVTYAVIRSRLPTAARLAVLTLSWLALVGITAGRGSAGSDGLARVVFLDVGLLPMLWYSANEERPPRRRLGPWAHLAYLGTRLLGAPVMPPGDLFKDTATSLARVRLGGVKALYVVLWATLTLWLANLVTRGVDPRSLAGPALLLHSYVYYLGRSMEVVIAINSGTAVLRLFGVPVRDSFRWWILARTPNEHWRRWNILFRDWIVKYVFFPIMRARRWLFAAVMSSLLASGLIHLVPLLLARSVPTFHAFMILAYWAVNGIVIYAVIKVPVAFPGVLRRLGMGRSRIWDVLGILGTSVFYAILTDLRANARSWEELLGYFVRLGMLAPGVPW